MSKSYYVYKEEISQQNIPIEYRLFPISSNVLATDVNGNIIDGSTLLDGYVRLQGDVMNVGAEILFPESSNSNRYVRLGYGGLSLGKGSTINEPIGDVLQIASPKGALLQFTGDDIPFVIWTKVEGHRLYANGNIFTDYVDFFGKPNNYFEIEGNFRVKSKTNLGNIDLNSYSTKWAINGYSGVPCILMEKVGIDSIDSFSYESRYDILSTSLVKNSIKVIELNAVSENIIVRNVNLNEDQNSISTAILKYNELSFNIPYTSIAVYSSEGIRLGANSQSNIDISSSSVILESTAGDTNSNTITSSQISILSHPQSGGGGAVDTETLINSSLINTHNIRIKNILNATGLGTDSSGNIISVSGGSYLPLAGGTMNDDADIYFDTGSNFHSKIDRWGLTTSSYYNDDSNYSANVSSNSISVSNISLSIPGLSVYSVINSDGIQKRYGTDVDHQLSGILTISNYGGNVVLGVINSETCSIQGQRTYQSYFSKKSLSIISGLNVVNSALTSDCSIEADVTDGTPYIMIQKPNTNVFLKSDIIEFQSVNYYSGNAPNTLEIKNQYGSSPEIMLVSAKVAQVPTDFKSTVQLWSQGLQWVADDSVTQIRIDAQDKTVPYIQVGDASASYGALYLGSKLVTVTYGGTPLATDFKLTVDSTCYVGQNFEIRNNKSLKVSGGLGVFGSNPVASKPTVSGSRGGNLALEQLLNVLASYGLIINATS